MELVKVWGWWLVLTCGVLLLRPSTCEKVLEMGEREEGTLAYGLALTLFGVATLVFNKGSFTELTVLGTLSTIVGILFFGAPAPSTKFFAFLRKNAPVALSLSALGLTYGLWLLLHY